MHSITINADNFPIYIALASIFVSMIAFIICAMKQRKDGSPEIARIAHISFIVSSVSIIYTSYYFMQQILSLARYDIAYIYGNSGPKDEWIYRISSFWAGQEGSLLLWALFGAIIGLLMLRKMSKSEPVAMAFWCSVQLFFLALLVVQDPFAKLVGFQPGVIGVGLKPLLKNLWMATHPPILFVGYAVLAVPAALAVQALIKGDLNNWVKKSLPWTVFGWTFLGAGLILGMVWSYEALGWGGFWAWDPVENASLIPWLSCTALLHGQLVQKHRGKMAWSNIGLALVTFLLVIYATFLVRSGVLSDVSVHSFSPSATATWIKGFLIFYAVFCLAISVIRFKSKKPASSPTTLVSKDGALVAGAVVMTLYAAVVLFGTSYPLLTHAAVKASFYNKMSIPIAIATVILIVLGSIIGWSRSDMKAAGYRFNNSLWKSGAHIAHIGVFLMILGIILSSNSKSFRVALPESGEPSSALGYKFAYDKWVTISQTKAVLNIMASRNSESFIIPLKVEMSENGAVWKPYIISSLSGDIYIAPGGSEQTMVTPTASLGQKNWLPTPAEIPNSHSTLKLIGMRVESKEVTLSYQPENGKSVDIIVSESKPASIDGYELTFNKFVTHGDKQTMGTSVGVNIIVRGHGLADRSIIEVSWKPFISLLWLGTAFITLGGLLALWRRSREKITQDS